MTYNIFGYDFEHLALARPMDTNPTTRYLVTTEEGYYIRKPSFGENVYKTSTIIYATDDVANIVIVAEADLPEGYEINGVDTQPEVEVASEEVETEEV